MTESARVRELQELAAKVQGALAGNDVEACISVLVDALATALAITADTPEQVDALIDDHLSGELKKIVRTKIATIGQMQGRKH